MHMANLIEQSGGDEPSKILEESWGNHTTNNFVNAFAVFVLVPTDAPILSQNGKLTGVVASTAGVGTGSVAGGASAGAGAYATSGGAAAKAWSNKAPFGIQ